jgi:DNA replication factor GINS
MYNELYAAWRREIDDPSLGSLQVDFYGRIAEYLKRMKEDNKTVDKKSVKVCLLEHEEENVERMLEELLRVRYRKIIKTITKTQKLPADLLTAEETKMAESFATFSDAYQKFAKNLMEGQGDYIAQVAKTEAKTEAPRLIHKRLSIRFLKNIPAIMGADMKSYGPFVAEDVASLPTQNAQVLVKQGLAVLIEVS